MISQHNTNLRWFVLVLIGVYPLIQFLIGEYPALLGEQIKSYFDVSQAEINYLLTFRTFPNMIIYFWSTTFLSLILINCDYRLNFMFCASNLKTFICMVIGRFSFGLFESSGFGAESYYINKLFKCKENSQAFWIDTALCILRSIKAAIIYHNLYLSSNNDLSQCLQMYLLIALISFQIIIILTQIDRCSNIRDKTTDQKLDSVDLRQIKNFSKQFYITLISVMTCYSICGFIPLLFLFKHHRTQQHKNFKVKMMNPQIK